MDIFLKDDYGILKSIGPGNCYRPFLLLALELTKTGNILELGCGHGSTPFLKSYSELNKRNLYSYDFNKEWADKFPGAISVNGDWENSDYLDRDYSVALIDESPAAHRGKAIIELIDKVDIFVAHDTEPKWENSYKMSSGWSLYKYVSHYKRFYIWSTIFSNEHDVTQYESINRVKIK